MARSWLIFCTAPPGTGSSPAIDWAPQDVTGGIGVLGSDCGPPAPPYTLRRRLRRTASGGGFWATDSRRSRNVLALLSREPPSTGADAGMTEPPLVDSLSGRD
eukprot:scaffold105678_cov32-Tisochrysis_lutea.AAC.1